MYNYGKGMTEETPYESHAWIKDFRNDIAPLSASSSTCEVCYAFVFTITMEGLL